MRNDRYSDHPETDPILDTLAEVLRLVDMNHHERQAARGQRGDTPLFGQPFITVTVETETRTYTGRVFDISRTDAIVDLYNTEVTDPALATPDHIIRAAAIVAAHVEENTYLLPVEFPMARTDLDAHTASFITKAATILTNPDYDDADAPVADVFDRLLSATAPVPVTTDQCDALREAARPVNDLMLDSPIPTKWDRYATYTTRTITGLDTRTVQALDDDPHLNVEILNTDDPAPGPTTLLKFLTFGVPLAFLDPETHQQALDAYRGQVRGQSRALR